MDRFIRIVNNIVFISTILILVRVLFVSSFPVNDGYNMAATLYLGKVTWVVVAASLIVAIINRRFFAVGWSDIMIVAFALLLYLNSSSLGLYKEQVLLLLSIYYSIRLLCALVDRSRYIFPLIMCGVLATQLYIAYSQLFLGEVSNHALFAFTGSFENPGPLCGFVAMLLPIPIYYAFKDEALVESENKSLNITNTFVKYCAAVVAMAGVALVVAGGSRTALIALVVGCLMLFVNRAMFNKLRGWYRDNRKLAIAVISVVVVLAVVALYLLFIAKADSAFGRLLLWRTTFAAIVENPFWGVGLGRFTSCYGEVQAELLSGLEPTDMWVRVADVPQYAFNEYLHFGVEGGVVAVLLLVGILVYTIYRSFKCGSVQGRVYGACLVVLAIFAFASYPFHVLPFMVVVTVVVATAVSNFERGFGRYYDRALFGLALLCCSFLVWRTPHYSDEKLTQWSSERRYYNMDIFETTVDNYGKLLPDFGDNYAFLFEYGRALAQTEQYELSDSILLMGSALSKDPMFLNLLGKNAVARGNYNSAEQYFKQSVRLLPNRHYPLYLLFDMCLQKGDTLNARIWGERVLNQPPKVNSKFIQEKQSEVRTRLKF